MLKLYNLKVVGIFNVLAKHDLQLHHAGQLFASAFMTEEPANTINAEFGDYTVTPYSDCIV